MGVIENRIDITELERSGGTAASVSYDNTGSGLTANTVQGAIDEVTGNLGVLEDEKAGKKQISNRNLLDNGWFTVNQRGKTSYAGTGNLSYTVDRWVTAMSADSALEVIDGGVEITIDGVSTDNAFAQILDQSGRIINGRIATLSAIIDGKLYSGSLTTPALPESGWKVENYFNSDGIRGEIARNASGTTKVVIRLPKDDTAHVIKAIKLEIGSISTLEMDAAPNYAEELLKCQRYFVRMHGGNTATIASGFCVNGNTGSCRFTLSLPTPMRTDIITPTISSLDDFKISGSDFAGGVTPTTFARIGTVFGCMQSVELKGTGFTTGGLAVLYSVSTSAYIDISADL